jgi:GNAT superfamily N-acetyltransferase
MPEIWQISLKDFIGNWPVVEYDRDFECACVKVIEKYEKSWLKKDLRPLEGYENFFLCNLSGGEGVLLILKDKWGDYDVVGGYVEETLWVEPSLRRKGLGRHLVIARAEMLGGRINPVSYTPAGLAAHRSAHALSVKKARQSGQRI